MSQAGRPVARQKAVADAVERAIIAKGGDVVQAVIAEFKPLYQQTLERALHAEGLVERCLEALRSAADFGDLVPARELLNELLGAEYPIPWWRRWRRRRR